MECKKCGEEVGETYCDGLCGQCVDDLAAVAAGWDDPDAEDQQATH